MRSWLSTLFNRALNPAVAAEQATVHPLRVAAEALRTSNVLSDVVYPPQDPGLPIATPNSLLADQNELISMLKLHAASTPAHFEERFLGPIRRVGEYVNLLPGSANAAFSGAGGLFRACVETAFATFRASDGRIFTGEHGVEARHKLEGRWRYVCFLAGLLYPVGGALNAMAVSDSRRTRWACELDSLCEWNAASGANRIFVTWTGGKAKMGPAPITATFALKVAGRTNVEWLNEGATVLVNSLVDIVTDSQAARDLIAADLVRQMWAAVQDREMARRPQNYGQLTIGSDIAPYLIDAMVGLSKDKWQLNKSVAFADKNGYYLQWPEAAKDIIDFCVEKKYPGIPSTEAALLSVLASLRLVAADSDGLALIQIADADGEVVGGVKLAKPGLLLGHEQTLDSVAASRDVPLAAIRAADPLAARVAPTVSRPTPVAVPQSTRRPREESPPILEQVDADDVLHQDGEDAERDDGESTASQVDAGPATGAQATSKNGEARAASPPAARTNPKKGKLVEGAVVDLSAMLPTEVAASLPNFHAQILGGLVQQWRTKTSGDRLMRMCENGAAFDLKILSDLTGDPPTFLSALGERGMLFTQPSTPGKMIHQIALTEGGQSKVVCFVLAHHTVRRLALA
jgi:hypothetical protein